MSDNNKLYLGLDIGTSGVRGVCINEEQRIIGSAQTTIRDSSRGALRNPLNWKAMLSLIFERLQEQINLQHIASISVDGQSGTVLLCDTRGDLFDNKSLLYNDSPSEETVLTLGKKLGSCPPTLGRAYQLWKQSGQPDSFHIVHQADWIAGLLSGVFNQSDENNALKTGYSAALGQWSFPLQKLPFKPDALPRITTPSSLMGYATTAFARKLGLSSSCRLVSGTTDGIAGFIAALGLNKLSPGMAVTSLGTTLIVKTLSSHQIEDKKHGVYSHKLNDLWIPGGASNSGAAVLLDYFTPQEINDLSKKIDPAIPSDLDYYPLTVKGERFPVNDPNMRSRVSPRPADDVEFLAGLFESIARIEKQAYKTLDSLGSPYPHTIISVGGGSQNTTWTAIRKRILQTEIITARQPQPAYGAALIALKGSLIKPS